jgi:hypothetical protein
MANYNRGQKRYNPNFGVMGNHAYNMQHAYNGPMNNPQPPKKSGAVYSTIKKGKNEGGTIINAWNTSKSKGLITATIAPYDKSDEIVESAKGNEYQKMIANVFYHRTGSKLTMGCLMNIKTKVVVLQDIGMMCSQNGSGVTASGKRATGYFGKFKRN